MVRKMLKYKNYNSCNIYIYIYIYIGVGLWLKYAKMGEMGAPVTYFIHICMYIYIYIYIYIYVANQARGNRQIMPGRVGLGWPSLPQAAVCMYIYIYIHIHMYNYIHV